MISQQQLSAHPSSSHISPIYKGRKERSMGFPRSSGNVHVFWHRVVHQSHCGYLFQHSSQWVDAGQLSSLCCPPLSAGESLLWCLEHPFLSSFSDLDISLLFFPFLPHHTALCLTFFSLNVFSEAPHSWLMGSAVSCSVLWSQLEAAVSGTGQPLVSQRLLCSPPAVKTLPPTPNTKLYNIR